MKKYYQPERNTPEWEMDRLAQKNCGYCGHLESNHVTKDGTLFECKICHCKKYVNATDEYMKTRRVQKTILFEKGKVK